MRNVGLYLGRLPGFGKSGFDRRELIDEMYAFGATLPLIPIPTEGSAAEKRRVIESLIA